MKAIILDANILIRAVLGQRVRHVAYSDAKKYLPALVAKRKIGSSQALTVLSHLEPLVLSIEADMYESFKDEAIRRIAIRDEDDWPVLACAMLVDCPIWTEDTDFFGTGVPIWTS